VILISVKRGDVFDGHIRSAPDVPRKSDMSDFCFSWPMLNHVLSQAKLMEHMMSRLGVDPAIAARIDRGTAFYEARTRCSDCPSVGSCRGWLASSEALPMPPDFCPNAAFTRAWLIDLDDLPKVTRASPSPQDH
jgi:Family of unknown function (DUF6455)